MTSQVVIMIKDESMVTTNINSAHSRQIYEERVENTLGSLKLHSHRENAKAKVTLLFKDIQKSARLSV